MKLTAPQRACLTYYLWLETREGPKPKWNQGARVQTGLLDKGLLTAAWVHDAKLDYDVKKIAISPAGKAALVAS
jgi:hypothetical protein